MRQVNRRRAPSFSGLDGWQQSAPRSVTQLRGSVAVVWFFSISSSTCMAMVPGLRSLADAHRSEVQVIGIHSPDFARDADPHRLGRAAAMAGMTWPVGMDHRRTVFSRWQQGPQQGWPCTFVVDRDGRIVAEHHGGALGPIEAAVEAALGSSG